MDRTTKTNDPYRVINQAEKGISINLFDTLVNESGYPKAVLAKFIGLDVRTVSNYRRQSKPFGKTEAEHLLKLKELFIKGKEVFNNMDEFREWLAKPSYGLESRVPITLLKYITGIDLVNRELVRIEYGDFS